MNMKKKTASFYPEDQDRDYKKHNVNISKVNMV